jgi:PadR family transcriptional regulator, regulatory protein PadR
VYATKRFRYCSMCSTVRNVNVATPGLERTQLLKGVLDAVVLAALAERDGYGYDVVRRLRLGGLPEVADASVYGTLRRLFAQGLLTSYVVPSDEGPHRKYYGLTKVGRKALDTQQSDWTAFAASVSRILDGDAFSITTGDET